MGINMHAGVLEPSIVNAYKCKQLLKSFIHNQNTCKSDSLVCASCRDKSSLRFRSLANSDLERIKIK